MSNYLKSAALVLALGSVMHVNAQVLVEQAPACELSTRTTGNAGYANECLGSFSGNMDNQLGRIWTTMTAAGDPWNTVAQAYVSSESFAAAMNPFSQNEGALDDGTINFDSAQTGLFVLGLKQANGFSLYLFDGSGVNGGISSIDYDTTGVALNGSFALSHAGFIGNVTPVPEPSAYAMMLAGLAVVGFALKRRRG